MYRSLQKNKAEREFSLQQIRLNFKKIETEYQTTQSGHTLITAGVQTAGNRWKRAILCTCEGKVTNEKKNSTRILIFNLVFVFDKESVLVTWPNESSRWQLHDNTWQLGNPVMSLESVS
jgi:hypothetical protein